MRSLLRAVCACVYTAAVNFGPAVLCGQVHLRGGGVLPSDPKLCVLCSATELLRCVRVCACVPGVPVCLVCLCACVPVCLCACVPGVPVCLCACVPVCLGACVPGVPVCLCACVPGVPVCLCAWGAFVRPCEQ
jgi:hypothetical protein